MLIPLSKSVTFVTQTKFGPDEGNCLAACLAALFDVSIDNIPDFDSESKKSKKRGGVSWWELFEVWCHERGYHPVILPPSSKPAGWSIISGKSPRGLEHACIAHHGELLHDPHPSRAGLLNITDYITFVPKSAQVMVAQELTPL